MPDVVVDSCVVAKWILPESDSADARRVLEDVISSGSRVVVLDLAFAEVANAIWKRLHRRLLTPDEADSFLHDLETLPVAVESARQRLSQALRIAGQVDRSVYDALFVATTHDLGLPGVTSDVPLHAAVHATFPEIVLLREWTGFSST